MELAVALRATPVVCSGFDYDRTFRTLLSSLFFWRDTMSVADPFVPIGSGQSATFLPLMADISASRTLQSSDVLLHLLPAGVAGILRARVRFNVACC